MKIKEIGCFLKKRRDILRLQQKDLAELSAVSLRTIIQIESGVGNPSLDTITKLTNVLGLEVQLKIIDK